MERLVKCPSCTREIRVTEEELLDKRGFCARCDARFDLLPEMFLGDGPNRSLEVVGAKLPDIPPSGKISVERAADGTETITIASAKPFPAYNLLFSIFWLGILVFFCSKALRSGNAMAILFPLFFIAIGV